MTNPVFAPPPGYSFTHRANEPEVVVEAVPSDAHDGPPRYDAEAIEAATPVVQPSAHGNRGRTPKGKLEASIKSVCDRWITGELVIPNDKPLTPARIAGLLTNESGSKVSAGAVSACLSRWSEYGFIDVTQKPFAFSNYTEAAVTDGLAALKAQHRARKNAA